MRGSPKENVLPQDATADGMKRPAPQLRQVLPDQLRHAPHHLLGRLVGEREEQHALRRDALLQQISHAIRQRARLARPCARNDEQRPFARHHNGALLFVKHVPVIDERRLGLRRFDHELFHKVQNSLEKSGEVQSVPRC